MEATGKREIKAKLSHKGPLPMNLIPVVDAINQM